MGVISGGKKERFYGENLMSYQGGMPGPGKYESDGPAQIKPSPADNKPSADWKNDKQSLLNQYRKFKVKAGNRIRKYLGEPNPNDEPQSIKREHSDLFSRKVH